MLGVEATGSLPEYDLSFLNNAVGYSAGVFADWKVTPGVQVRPRAGYLSYSFETAGAIGRAGNPSTYYFSLELEHLLKQYVSHSLEGGREVRLGIYSDFEDIFYVRHGVSWKIIMEVSLGTQFFYEHGTYPPLVFFAPGDEAT